MPLDCSCYVLLLAVVLLVMSIHHNYVACMQYLQVAAS